MPRDRPQILVFSYHKTGTTLFERVMRKVAARFDLRVGKLYGQVWDIDPSLDIVLLPHSLLGLQLTRPFVGLRAVRDPRDIWVSAYLYHLRCNEGWCVTAHPRFRMPIRYPRVDFAIEHRSERFKRDYLRRLNGKSYQRHLLDRGQAEGLDFELAHYTSWTLEAMRSWRPLPTVMDVRLEDVATAYDTAMQGIFRHLGFDAAACAEIADIAATEDVARMPDAAIMANTHVYSRTLSKWRAFLSPAQIAAFEARHGDLITSLGYALSAADDLSAAR